MNASFQEAVNMATIGEAWIEKIARGYREFSFSRSGTQAAVEMRPK
jgi:hypothetical protein